MTIRKGFDYDLGYCCFLLSEISFITCNKLSDTIRYFKYDKLKKIYDSACVFHCEDPVDVSKEFIEYLKIERGNVNHPKHPTSIELGDVLGRLIYDLASEKKVTDKIYGIIEVFNNEDFMDKLENPDTDLYWQSAEDIFDYYTEGCLDWLQM